MKITPAMICDICLLVLLLLVVFRYMHRGFLSDIVNLLGSVVSIAGAMFVSHTYSEPIFDQLLRPGLEKSVMKNIAENGLDVAALAEKYGGFLPPTGRRLPHRTERRLPDRRPKPPRHTGRCSPDRSRLRRIR